MHLAHAHHDHQSCIEQALQQASTLCQQRQLRLTAIRREVLTAVWSSHRPVGAYTILEQLTTHRDRAPAPPTVYRALDFLPENGLIHRIASLNAFVGCSTPGDHHSGQFFICQHCGVAAELSSPAVDAAIADAARQQHFAPHSQCVEIVGCCRRCGDQDND